MEGLLTPVSTSYKSLDQGEEDILVEVKNPEKLPPKPAFKASSPTEALEILKNEPDHETLVSTLRSLNEDSSDFSITSPSPLAAQLVHVIVSSIVPNYWNLLFNGTKSLAKKRAKSKKLSDLELVLSCLRSSTGLNALLLNLKQLIQQSKETKKAVGGPNIPDVLTILLQVLTEVIKDDETVEEISNSIWNTATPSLKQKAVWNEFLSTVGTGKIVGLAAEAEDVANGLSKKVDEKYWIADGRAYSSWLARNITHWARSLHPDSEIGHKCCGELLGRAFRLGYTGKLVGYGFESHLTYLKKMLSKRSSRLYSYNARIIIFNSKDF
jgi:telomere length regulation protein